VAEWSDEQKDGFDVTLKDEKERVAHEAQNPDLGDLVETPDGRQWVIVVCSSHGALDLRNDKGEELRFVSKDQVKVVRKAE
jgi:hypothetical protein